MLVLSFLTTRMQAQCPYTATISGTTDLCLFQITNLDISFTGGIPPYQIELFTGGGIFTISNYFPGQPIMVSPYISTVYSLVSVTDAVNCEAEVFGEAAITVLDLPSPVPAAITSCEESNGLARFDLTSVEAIVNDGTGYPVSWFEDQGRTQPINAPSTYMSNTANIYAGIFDGVCESALVPVTLTVVTNPEANSIEIEVCGYGGMGTFNLIEQEPLISTGANQEVHWYVDEDLTQEISNPAAFTTSETVIYATVSQNGCTSIPTPISLFVQDIPEFDINGPLSFCESRSTSLTVEGNFQLYLWSTGETGPSITVNEPGIYSVTVINATGCSGERSVQVTEEPAPVPTITGPMQICHDESLTLTAPAGFSSYFWSTGDTTQTTSINEARSYSLIVTDSLGCDGSTGVTISPYIEIQCNQTGQASGRGVPDGRAEMSITGGTPPYQITWSGAATGGLISSGPGTVLIPNLKPGLYEILVAGADSCQATCFLSINTNNLLPNCTDAAAINLDPAPADCNLSSSNSFVFDNLNSQTLFETDQLWTCLSVGGLPDVLRDTWFRFTATGDVTRIRLQSTEIEQPILGVFRGADCYHTIPVKCGSGNLINLELETAPGREYHLMVAGSGEDDRGEFALTIESQNHCEACLIEDNFAAFPPPENGFYEPGQTVRFCYTISDWEQVSVSWVHGMEIQFGGAWDRSTFSLEVPDVCSSNWSWFALWEGCASQQNFGPGIAIQNKSIGNCSPGGNFPIEGPGYNYGCSLIPSDNAPEANFCWTIQVRECYNNTTNDLSIYVNPLSDAQSGGWLIIDECSTASSQTFEARSSCTSELDLHLRTTNTSCTENSGTAEVFATGGTNDYTYNWSTGQTVPSISDLSLGQYSLTVSDGERELVRSFHIASEVPPTLQASALYGGSDVEQGNAVVETTDGSFVIGGTSRSADGNLPGNAGASDWWLSKIDASGNVQWSNHFGGSQQDELSDLIQTPDDGYLAVGKTGSADGDVGGNYGNTDGWVVRTDAQGNLIWEKHLGSSGMDEINHIEALPNGNYLLAGSAGAADNDVATHFGETDFWVIEMTLAGEIIWENSYGGSLAERAYAATATIDGKLAIIGTTQSTDGLVTNNLGNQDIWLIKIDEEGNLLWETTYGGAGEDAAYDLVENHNGQLIFVGSTTSDIFPSTHLGGGDGLIYLTDAVGQVVWKQNIGGSDLDQFNAVQYHGGLMVVGSSRSADGALEQNAGEEDAWVCFFDDDGALVWQQQYGSDVSDRGQQLLVDSNGNLQFLGQTDATDDVFSGNNGATDIFVLSLFSQFGVSVMLGTDTLICAGESILLEPTITNCEDCTYQWDDGSTGTTRTVTPMETTTYSVTIASGSGCQASDALVVEVSNPPTTNLSEVICLGEIYALGGQVFSQSGNYQVILPNTVGCDSLIELDLTVTDVITSTLDTIISQGDTVQVGNQYFSIPGNYEIPLTASAGCDSVILLNLQWMDHDPIQTAIPTYPLSLLEEYLPTNTCGTISPGLLYLANYTAFGAFSSGLSSIGLDSGLVLSTGDIEDIVGPNQLESTGTQFNLQGDPDLQLLGPGSVYDASSFEFSFIPESDSIGLRYVYASEEYCEYDGTQLTDRMAILLSGPGINGPFSNNSINIATVPYSLDPVAVSTINQNNNSQYYLNNNDNPLCAMFPPVAFEEIEFDGFTVPLVASATNLVPGATYHIKVVIGDVGDAVFDSAIFIEASGLELRNAPLAYDLGPDLEACFGEPIVIDATLQGCPDCTYSWSNGQTTPTISVFQDDTYGVTVTTPDGCTGEDSIQVAFHPPTMTLIQENICEGEGFTLGASTYTEPGNYMEVFSSSLGCDSTILLSLSVFPTYEEVTEATICAGESYEFGGETLVESGFYQQQLVTVEGCDSIISLNLTVLDVPVTTIDTTILQGESITVAGNTYAETGIYRDTIPGGAANACDSIIVTDLSILITECNSAGTTFSAPFNGQSNDSSPDTIFLCFGDTLKVRHNGDFDLSGDPDPATAPGIGYAYYDCLPSITGPTLDTILTDSCLNHTSPLIVNGDEVEQDNGIWITAGPTPDGDLDIINNGSTQETFNNGEALPTQLWLAPITVDNFNQLAFENDGSGNAGPCVSVSTVEAFSVVFLNEIAITNLQADINGCGGYFKVTGGLPELNNSQYTVSITKADNPDISGDIVSNPAGHQDSVFFTVPEAGTYNILVDDGKGCPAMTSLEVNFPEVAINILNEVSCNGSSDGALEVIVTVDGNAVPDLPAFNFSWDPIAADEPQISNLPAGDYSITVTSPLNCQVIAQVTLAEPDLIETTINASICQGDSYTFGSGTYDVAGTYTESFTSIEGCDSVVTLLLEVFPSPIATISASDTLICAGEVVTLTGSDGFAYQWSTGENTAQITISPLVTTTYALTVTDENGCSNEAEITINVEDEIQPLTLICLPVSPSEVLFTWDPVSGIDNYDVLYAGQTQTISGTEFTVSNLFPDESVTIEVTPIYDGPCPVESAILTCTSASCPDLTLEVEDLTLCSNDLPIQLTANTIGGDGSGSYNWQGTGILSPGGVFDPSAAGIGQHLVMVNYAEGICEFQETLIVTVVETPVAIFNLENQVCDDSLGTITFQGNVTLDAVFHWDFDGGMASPGVGPGPHEVTWPTHGLKTVSLTVEQFGCISEPYSRDIEVENQLAAPNISCVGFGDQLAFGWAPVSGATGYDIDVLTGQMPISTGNLVTFDHIEPGEAVTLEVTALNGGGVCPNSVDTLTCVGEDSPIIIMLTAPDFAFDEETGTIQATPKGANGIFKVTGPYPNPTRDLASMELFLESPQLVKMEVIDINGRVQKLILHAELGQGDHPLTINTHALLPGLYFIKVSIAGQVLSRKLAVIK